MEKCFNSSRYDGFPAGLRVLVVDDDPTWIKILEKMLKKCSYEVTTCGLATTALSLLREKKDRFDIVISDVNMPDMDGFKLLELLGLEMDLPVIIMSVDGETSRVMKGVQHGACDYLLKPVRMKELRNIWQHVLRKKIHEVKDVESQDSNDGISTIIRNGSDEFDEGHVLSGDYQNSAMKRKEMVNEEPEDHEIGDPSSAKKARVVWSVDLHQKFVKAVNQIGFDKVGPKKILDLMNVPGLTRENVASHLQKYRLYLTRLQKQDEDKASFIITQPDIGSKDQSGNFGLQSSIPMNKDNSENIFGTSGNELFAQDGVLETHQDHLKSMVSLLPVTDAKTSLPINNISRIGDLSFGSMFSDISSQIYPWGSDEIPSMQLIPNQTSNDGSFLLHEESCSKPLEVHGFQTHSPPVDQRSCSDTIRSTPQIKLEFFGSGGLINTSPVLDPQEFMSCNPPYPDKHFINQNSAECNKFPDKLSTLPHESVLCSSVNGFQLCSLQGLGYSENLYPNNAEIFDYDIQSLLFDGLEYSRDYASDSTENYSVINKGLFII